MFLKRIYNRLKNSSLSSTKSGIILISVFGTLWFLIRVIPKPTRATYPCMRAVAPFIVGACNLFVVCYRRKRRTYSV